MTSDHKISFLTIVLLAVMLHPATVSLAAGKDRPNILFIMSDDHAVTAIGAYGGRLAPLNPTPTLDKLAAEGMVLENTFCNNSVCSPSRVSILTGQYSHINGVTSLGGKVAEENQTLPLAMRTAGYQTAVIGKWHLGIQPLAFDYYKVLQSQGKYHNPEFFERVSPDAEEASYTQKGYCSDLIAKSSIVKELAVLLDKYIIEGRSTPGARQDNDPGKRWSQIDVIRDYIPDDRSKE